MNKNLTIQMVAIAWISNLLVIVPSYADPVLENPSSDEKPIPFEEFERLGPNSISAVRSYLEVNFPRGSDPEKFIRAFNAAAERKCVLPLSDPAVEGCCVHNSDKWQDKSVLTWRSVGCEYKPISQPWIGYRDWTANIYVRYDSPDKVDSIELKELTTGF